MELTSSFYLNREISIRILQSTLINLRLVHRTTAESYSVCDVLSEIDDCEHMETWLLNPVHKNIEFSSFFQGMRKATLEI